MKNIVIYYSDFNIDSSLAALILRESFNDDDDGLVNDVQMINYIRSIDFKPPERYDTIYIVGPVFHSLHLETLLFTNPNVEIIIFNINNDLNYKGHILKDIRIINSPIHEEDNSFEFKDLSTLMINSLELYQPSNSILASEDFKELISAILKYKRFQVMSDIQELVFVNECIDLVKECIDENLIVDDVPINSDIFYTENKYAYNKHILKIRAIINRNFTLKTLVSGSSLLTAPVFNVSEEYAVAVMRLVSYSYDDVITYEDTATYRIYRVYSPKNKEWLIKCVKPHDSWMEGEILMMKTDVPVHESR